MINRFLRPLPALRRLLLGLAVALVLVLAVRAAIRGRIVAQTAAPPGRLPADAAVALLDENEGSGVWPAAHVEANGGRLEFAPPPLSNSHPLPTNAEAPQPAQPAASLLDKMADRFDPAVTLPARQATAPAPRVSAPPSAAQPEQTSPAQVVRRLPPAQFEPTPPPSGAPIASTRRTPPQDIVVREAQAPAAAAVMVTPTTVAPVVVPPVVAPPAVVHRPAAVRPPVASLAPPNAAPPADIAAVDAQAGRAATVAPPAHEPRYAKPDRYASPPAASPPVDLANNPAVRVAAAPSRAPLIPTMAAPRQPTRPRSLEWQRHMTPVAARADAQIRTAFETCGRGALFAGRSEMIQALRMIAQNADALERGSAHSDALAAGMRAMAEAESFAPRGSRLESELDMATLVASHRTPVVREALAGAERGQKMTPLEAQNRYYTYAQQQLAEATAGIPVGAIALYGLGKIHTTLAAADNDAKAVEEPQAMTLFQAALLVDPGNPLAAHELGVMLARYQRTDEALAMLQHSAMIASLPETWQNLAIVHAQRGEADLSRRAKQEAENARQRLTKAKPASHPALARGSVRWLSATEFAQLRPGDTNPRPGGEAKAAPTPPTAETEKPSGVLSWLPWTTKR